MIEKARGRVAGLPRSFAEFHRSLALLARFRELGWHRSVGEGAPVARDGSALAFFNYPALFWLEPLLRPSDTVFEYGSGNSTRWFADRDARGVAVEHDPIWFDRVRRSIPDNAEVSLRTSAYADAISEASLDRFDIVLIDGPERHACARRAIEHVVDDGLILFDNSDRPHNADALVELAAQGFSRIDFAGPMSGYADLSCTSACFKNGQRWTRPPGTSSFPRRLHTSATERSLTVAPTWPFSAGGRQPSPRCQASTFEVAEERLLRAARQTPIPRGGSLS